MDCESEHFCYITLVNGTKVYLKTEWMASGINLLLIQGETLQETAWKGTLPMWEIKSKAQDLEVPFDDFLSNTKLALTTAAETFLYEVSDDSFRWTKVEVIKILYGSVKLTKSPEVPVGEICLSTAALIKELRQQLSTKSRELEDLQEVSKKCSEEFSDYVAKCNERENELLSKMTLLLNSKKRHIALLQKHVTTDSQDSEKPALKSQRRLQDSDASSQELDVANLPKRLKTSSKPLTRLQMKEQPSTPSGSKEGDSNVYDKDTLDLDLIN